METKEFKEGLGAWIIKGCDAENPYTDSYSRAFVEWEMGWLKGYRTKSTKGTL